ncbi:peptide-methionine (S)-S-oxide reductase MsrA [Keguizhuia sedimenti]|uniref:peptide-methionine (S)-S-oxide reductase MsrA n=1 Tax=Keguizhuia sedimenti TaxID=3064264 RepID=UPI003BB0B0A8
METATATFAGGCFWSVEADSEKLPGVLAAESGYAGGKAANPTYRHVSAGGTAHAETLRITYDPQKISYTALPNHFCRHIDPTAKDAQFCGNGTQYRTVIFMKTQNNGPQQKPAGLHCRKVAVSPESRPGSCRLRASIGPTGTIRTTPEKPEQVSVLPYRMQTRSAACQAMGRQALIGLLA